MNQLSLLSGINTPAKSSENEPQQDGSPICECGKGMSECLIHPNTPEKWIASMRDSLARTLALLESRQVYLREPDQVFTEKSCVLLTRYDPSISSWKMSQQSFLTDSEPFSETWPRWGMTQDGAAFVHPMSERRITETDGGFMPTPTTRDYKDGKMARVRDGKEQMDTIGRWVQFYPTPRAAQHETRNHKVYVRTGKYERLGHYNLETKIGILDPSTIGGLLNPNWVGWLMGFPIGWANSKDMATRKSRYKPQSRGNYSEDNEE